MQLPTISEASSEKVLFSSLSRFEAPDSPSVWPSKLQDPAWWLCFQSGVGSTGEECCINLNLMTQEPYSKAITLHPSGLGLGVLLEKALGIIPSRKRLFALWFIKTPPLRAASCWGASGSFSQQCENIPLSSNNRGSNEDFWFPCSPLRGRLRSRILIKYLWLSPHPFLSMSDPNKPP